MIFCVEVAEEADLEQIAGSRDDEYRWAGVEDPKILITTSHSPSSKLKEFAKVKHCSLYDSYPQRLVQNDKMYFSLSMSAVRSTP